MNEEQKMKELVVGLGNCPPLFTESWAQHLLRKWCEWIGMHQTVNWDSITSKRPGTQGTEMAYKVKHGLWDEKCSENVLSLPLDIRRTIFRRLRWPKHGATGGLDPGSFWLASLLQGSRCSSGNSLRYRCPSSLKCTQVSSLLEEASQDTNSNLYSCLCSENQSV